MLSRVAESLYWMARYLERAEDLARLINVNSNLVLDLPHRFDFGWEPLIEITGDRERFDELYEELDERSVVRFLVADRRNTGSILSALDLARENLRTTRDIVPREAWEQLNDLYMTARQRTHSGVPKRGRYEFLNNLIRSCQQITGLLAGTMSRNEAYWFIKAGRYLERADMTTRIVDVRSEDLLAERSDDLTPFENIQWMSVLKSLTAYQMYRHHVRLRVRAPDVLRFLLQHELFPRAVVHCLGEVTASLQHLPNHGAPVHAVHVVQADVREVDVQMLWQDELHRFLDRLQVSIADLHGEINATWFAVEQEDEDGS
ncbi:MAG: alpha-E domain-containing protein [Xanthomonadaceae bacterium]|nr:alpha-E domain-containing protein [Xanthomonadaceae bacterium]